MSFVSLISKIFPRFLTSLLCLSIWSGGVLYGLRNPPKSTEAIQRQLERLESRFEDTREMFNPWYTGPLLASSAHVMHPGFFNLQPYFFITNASSMFDQHGHKRSTPHVNQLVPLLGLQAGIVNGMDATLVIKGVRNKMEQQSFFHWGDSSLSLGFRLIKETATIPALKLVLKETFPTGKYQHLSPKKLHVDATGMGAYQTFVGLHTSKIVWWVLRHPMDIRFNIQWSIPTSLSIRGSTVYGGTYDTRGTIHMGHGISTDLGWEFSLSQPWVLTLDIVYFYLKKITFSGYPGSGISKSSIENPFMDQWSLAPGIEYNLNANFGFVGGYWFAIWGRNSSNFRSGIVSFCWTF